MSSRIGEAGASSERSECPSSNQIRDSRTCGFGGGEAGAAQPDEALDLGAVDGLVLEQAAGHQVEAVAVLGERAPGSAPRSPGGSSRPPRR